MPDRQAEILQAAVRVIAQDGVRGMRIEKLAAQAKVSIALIYYYFKDRAGVLSAALDHINKSAERYTSQALGAAADPRTELEQMLLLEFQDTPQVRENSVAWGELRASAVFTPDLREPLRMATQTWLTDTETLIRQAQDAGHASTTTKPADAAQRLTALVEGLSERWHSGSLSCERARELMSGAIAAELGPAKSP